MTTAAHAVTPQGLSSSALMAVLACLPLGWIQIVALGDFDLTLPYAMTLLLGVTMLFRFRRSAMALRDLVGRMAPFLTVYVFYLLILALSVAGMPSKGIVVRQAFFLICGMTVASSVIALGANARTMRRGGAFAIFGFLAVTEYYARQNGLSWLIALERFVSSGDLNFIVYQFFREIFRTAQSGGSEVAASLKNAVAVGLFTAMVIFRASHERAVIDRRGQAITVLALVVLVLLNTRSVLLIAAAALPMAAAIAAIRRPQHSANRLVLKSLLFLAGLVTVLIILSADTAAIARLEDRFAFGDNSVGGRFQQIEMALAGIEQNILFGSGLQEFDGQLVHNLFLGAWLHAGLGAFLLVAVAYLAMLGAWGAFVFRIVTQRDAWVLPLRVEWVAVLPLLPLFRVWIAGDAGHPDFSGWIAIFAFFAITVVNEKTRYKGHCPITQTTAVAA